VLQTEEGQHVDVAIKMPKDTAEADVKLAFQKEMALMASMETHPYIVSFVSLQLVIKLHNHSGSSSAAPQIH
jgi:hypothetical protein